MPGPAVPARFRALVVDRDPSGAAIAELRELATSELPDQGEVLVAVARSSLNYKDALAVTGRGKVLRAFPMVPGIDLAGVVVASEAPAWRPGDAVIGTGWQLGERLWGGLAELARVPAGALVPLPAGRDAHWAMGVGTAGLTAMLAVMALEAHGVRPGAEGAGPPPAGTGSARHAVAGEDDASRGAAPGTTVRGDVVVTGAAGGVGSVAVALLAAAGHRVVASTGRVAEAGDYLRALGAAEVVDRAELATPPDNPLGSARWAGAVDTVGGTTLATVLATLRTHGAVAACGVAGGSAVATTVFPFILRGVALVGIDSNTCPGALRRAAWERLAHALPPEALAPIVREVPLSEVVALCPALLDGRVRGRTVVDVGR